MLLLLVFLFGVYQCLTSLTLSGIAGLSLSVALLTNPGESNFGGDIVIQLLLAAADAIIGPCFALLTVAWYANTNSGCIMRLLLWASSYPVLISTVQIIIDAANGSDTVNNAVYAGLAAVCLFLSVYIFACVDMPGVVRLDGGSRKGRLRGLEGWRKNPRSLPVRLWGHGSLYDMLCSAANRAQWVKLFVQPTAWFVFGAAFFGAASVPLDDTMVQNFHGSYPTHRAETTFLILLPIAALGSLLVRIPITRGTFSSAPSTSQLPHLFLFLHAHPLHFVLCIFRLSSDYLIFAARYSSCSGPHC